MSGRGRGLYQKGGGKDKPGLNNNGLTNQKCGVGEPRGVIG